MKVNLWVFFLFFNVISIAMFLFIYNAEWILYINVFGIAVFGYELRRINE